MSKPQSLLVVTLLVLLAAAGALLLLQGAGAKPDANEGPTATAPVAEPEPPADGTSSDRAVAVREAVAPRAEDESPAPEHDPEIQRALAGFTGRVLHHDGKPAAGQRVVLYQFDLPVILGEVQDLLAPSAFEPDVDAGEDQTGDDGRFAIRGAWPRGFYLLHAGAGGDNPTAQIVERTPGPGEVVDLGDIRLRDGAVLTGTVVDEAGQPVAGALVRALDIPLQLLQMVPLERFDPTGTVIVKEGKHALVFAMPAWVKQRFEQLPLPAARSDAEGKFRVSGIEAGGPVLVVNAPGFPTLTQPLAKLEPGQQRDLGPLRLKEGEEVFGKVVDAAGRPIEGAEVVVGQAALVAPLAFAFPAGRTDAKGQFAAKGLAGGKVLAAARRGPGSRWMVEGPQPVVRDLTITLPARHRLTVRLVSAAGRPIEQPVLRLLCGQIGNGAVEMARFGFADSVELEGRIARLDDGRIELRDLDAGEYALLVRAAGHAAAALRIELERDAEQMVTLQPAVELRLRVADSQGKPVRGAQVYLEASGRKLSDMPLPCGRTGADGRLIAGDISAGPVEVTARHPAFGQVHGEAEVPGPELTLTMQSPGAIEGLLTTRGQPPEPGKWTLVVSPKREHGAAPDLPRLGAPDLQGKWKVAGLQPGDYEVMAIESIKALASPGALVKMGQSFAFSGSAPEVETLVQAGQSAFVALDTAQGPEIPDGPSAHVHGTVLVDGRAGEGMVVAGWAQRRLSAVVDAGGRFDFGQVREGHVWLQLHDPQDTEVFGRGGQLWSHSVEIKANQDLVLDIVIQTGGVAGRVTLRDGTPVAGAQVHLSGIVDGEGEERGSSSSGTVTDELGQFQVLRLPAGKYTVQVNDHDEHRGVAGVAVAAGSVADVRIEVRATVKLSGRVDLAVFGARKPQWIWMNVQPASGTGAGEGAQIQESGEFELAGLVPGQYTGQVWGSFPVKKGDEETWDSQMFQIVGPLTVGEQDQKDVVLRLEAVQEPKQGDGR